MSAYRDVFLNALCVNYSHTTLKAHSGYHIMQLLLVTAVFERINALWHLIILLWPFCVVVQCSSLSQAAVLWRSLGSPVFLSHCSVWSLFFSLHFFPLLLLLDAV